MSESRIEPLLTLALNVDDREEQVAMTFGRAFSNHTHHRMVEVHVMQPFRFREAA